MNSCPFKNKRPCEFSAACLAAEGRIVAEQGVGIGVARGDGYTFGGCAGFEQRLDPVGAAALLPVGVGAGADGELQRGAAFAVEGIDGCASFEEKAYGGGVPAPGGHVQGGRALRIVEI